jgi:hypothetical protein
MRSLTKVIMLSSCVADLAKSLAGGQHGGLKAKVQHCFAFSLLLVSKTLLQVM